MSNNDKITIEIIKPPGGEFVAGDYVRDVITDEEGVLTNGFGGGEYDVKLNSTGYTRKGFYFTSDTTPRLSFISRPSPEKKKVTKRLYPALVYLRSYRITDHCFESEEEARKFYGSDFVRLLTEYPAIEVEVEVEG